MKVHLSGICGTAMASLAALLKTGGHQLTGSDQDVFPPMSTQLEALGIPLRSPYAADNVPVDADVVVIGNALSRGNPEVEVVLDRKQRMTSLPAMLADEFLRGRTSLVVAGTHGKTTTTSLVAHLLERAGREPSFLVGGVPTDFGVSARLGRGPHFVIEGDEYDSAFFDKRPKFVHYLPDVAVIGNVEFDHADIYADLAAVQTAFFRLLSVVPRRGLVVAGIESPALAEMLGRALSRVETFGIGVEANWRADALRPGSEGWRFRLRHDGRDQGEFLLALPGEHNVRNALAALAVVASQGVEPAEAREALANFRGVKRRLELRGCVRGIAVYDDFAHHPTAVRETLAGAPGAAGRPALGRLRAPLVHLPHSRLPGRFRARPCWRRSGAGSRRASAREGPRAGTTFRGSPGRCNRRQGWSGPVRAGGGSDRGPARHGTAGRRACRCPFQRGFGGIHERLLRALAVS